MKTSSATERLAAAQAKQTALANQIKAAEASRRRRCWPTMTPARPLPIAS